VRVTGVRATVRRRVVTPQVVLWTVMGRMVMG
jgi:hypothetical protein